MTVPLGPGRGFPTLRAMTLEEDWSQGEASRSGEGHAYKATGYEDHRMDG